LAEEFFLRNRRVEFAASADEIPERSPRRRLRQDSRDQRAIVGAENIDPYKRILFLKFIAELFAHFQRRSRGPNDLAFFLRGVDDLRLRRSRGGGCQKEAD